MVPTPTCKLVPETAVPVEAGAVESLLAKEWLMANRLGAYSSSTVIGCNTRRYHALLVAAATPPAGRLAALSSVMEELAVEDRTYELAVNEFAGTFAPRGFEHLQEFRQGASVSFLYQAGGRRLLKEVVLADDANAVTIRYSLRGGSGVLTLRPFAALRDYHHLRKVHQAHGMSFTAQGGLLSIHDRSGPPHALHLACPGASFQPRPQWWYRFCYRQEIARGQDGFEDLYTPGGLSLELSDGQSVALSAWLDEGRPADFGTAAGRRARRMDELASSAGASADAATRRLAAASDAFLADRPRPDGRVGATILAGYHWFADWGRDAFIALPGLLLETGRHEAARQVLGTFAAAIRDGMVPNRFEEGSGPPAYNSIDASLWFVLAAERFVRAAGDADFWLTALLPACQRILQAYHDGTAFGIRADADGLLTGGSAKTQLTWMDAAAGGQAVTPRHGKAVEVNALWHAAHRILARRCRGVDDRQAAHYARRADRIAESFAAAFWNPQMQCLYDCISDGVPDGSVRPNQVLAMALPDCPLPAEQQASALRVVREHLLTPLGLRSLSPFDGRYRRRYGGSWESRDRAYHQGTVWAWLIGPFIDAYLRVQGATPRTLDQCRLFLSAFETHLDQAGLGFVSEIFDGDPPHAPRGCVAQAWSVAEVLRAKRLVAKLSHQPVPSR